MTTSRILCDSEGCDSTIFVERDITELEAALIAKQRGWAVQSGAQRDYHRCPRCREQQP